MLDFIPICREQYDTSYQTGFSRDFRESYGVSFKAGFSENIRPAYERALLQSFPDLFKQAEQRGAKDQGILDAFAQTMPQVKADEYARGRQLLSDTLSTGYLLSAQKLVILDGDADGVLTPGESVKLALTIDNHGKQASPLAGARFRIISHVGLENIQFEARELPAIQAQNRVKLTGVTQAKVAELSAGEKIRVEGVLELKTAAGDFVPIGQVSTDSEVHFPLELEALTPAKAGRVDETISAKVRFRNRGSKQTDAVRATLLTQPAIVSVPSGEISIPSLESGAASEMNILIKPGVWVGGNTLVKFVSRIASTTGTQNSQVFRQKIDIDRAGSLHLFDLSGKELPMATIVTSAGSTASFLAQFKFQRTTSLPGPFVVHATRTSDPEITLASGSTTSVNYGSWSPSKKADLLRFNYAVPTKLKGQSAWVMIQLSEANQAIHAMQVFLDVR